MTVPGSWGAARCSSLGAIHADGLGSITATTNSTGTVTKSFNYSAWGEIECPAATPGCTQEGGYRFTGREWDPETGLYYYRARYYSAAQGRFISEDPIGFAGGSNFYSYVGNAPSNFVDPSGLLKRDSSGKLIWRPLDHAPFFPPSVDGRRSRAQAGVLFGDDGTPILAMKNIGGGNPGTPQIDPGWDTDCHGVTFADGEYWINWDEADQILKADRYKEVTKPKVGDVVIYRNSKGKAVHSVTVVATSPILVGRGEAGIQTESSDLPVTPGPGGAWPNTDVTVHYYRK